MTSVEVVVTVRVPEGSDIAEVTEAVASWSAALETGVGWRVVAVENVEASALVSLWEGELWAELEARRERR